MSFVVPAFVVLFKIAIIFMMVIALLVLVLSRPIQLLIAISDSSGTVTISEAPSKKVREEDAAATLAGMAPSSNVIMTSDGIMTNNPLLQAGAPPDKVRRDDWFLVFRPAIVMELFSCVVDDCRIYR